MIVTLEGLSCAGKSTLANELKQQYDNTYVQVPEFIVDTSNGINTQLCMVNDIAKSQLAGLYNDAHDVIVDRGHLSTITYAHADGKEDIAALEGWYEEKLADKTIMLPDLFVYMRVSPEFSVQRARRIGRFTADHAWYTATEKACEKYDEYFLNQTPEVDTLVLHVEDMSLSELSKAVHNAVIERRAAHV